jgi:hypothetical protein
LDANYFLSFFFLPQPPGNKPTPTGNNHPPCVVLPVDPVPHPQREADALGLFFIHFPAFLSHG